VIDGGDTNLIETGKMAIYIAMDRDAVLNDPITRQLIDQPGIIRVWHGNDRRAIMRHCSGTISFVLVFPGNEALFKRKFHP